MDEELKKYIKLIRKYPTYKLLNYLYLESIDIFENHENGFKFEIAPVYNIKTKKKIKDYRFDIGQWDLIEISFNSIKYGTDYRNTTIDRTAFYTLLDKNRHMSELLEDAENIGSDNILKHIMCISNMQFDLEQLHIKKRFNRLYHIMMCINKNKEYDQTKNVCYINFEEKFEEIIGIKYTKYLKCYIFLLLITISYKSNNIMELIDIIDIDEEQLGFSKDDVKKLIMLEAKEYDFYKNNYNWNILKYNPIVKSDRLKDNYLITNVPALLITFSEFMYWRIRNYYKEIDSNDFTNYFGHCFEYYLDEFLNYYKINHDKIIEGDDKKPDWKIETSNYLFLIEQKAALFPINTRTITIGSRIKELDKYLKNNIENAFEQLNNYNETTKKIIIRICLTFEKIHITETVQELVIPNVKNVKEEYLNWLIPIDDFEKLFIILSDNELEFNKIIEKKIKLEKEKYKNGRGFDTLLENYSNDYIFKHINKFDELIKSEAEAIDKTSSK